MANALSTTKWVEFIDKNKFAKAALDKDSKTFVIHIVALKAPLAGMAIHPSQAVQISADNPMEIAALYQDEALTKVLPKYVDYTDIFSYNLAMELSENRDINKHTIKLKEGKQSPYGPIYSLGPVKLENLKTYIKIYLKTGFIGSSKSPAVAPILFDKKPNSSLYLCVDYQGLNNLTIKNWYLLLLNSESLDWLDQTKQFTQLDLTSAYHQMRIGESKE